MLLIHKNWLKLLPRELVNRIFEYCDETTIIIMTYVSNDIATYLAMNFPLNMNPKFDLCTYGAIYGHINIIKWALAMNHDDNTNMIMIMKTYLARAGDANKFSYRRLLPDVISTMARRGHLSALKFIYENGYFYQDDFELVNIGCGVAALYGRLEILEWVETIIPQIYWDIGNIMGFAASRNNLNVIKWLVKRGHIIDFTTYRILAINSFINIFIWMKDNYPGWDPVLCREVALYCGASDIVAWLDTNK